MSEIDALEARLRAHPEDTHSWLVYADWLLEQGDERGEIIALSHRARSLPEPERRELLRRASEIEERYREEQLGARLINGMSCQWRYGFIISVWMPCRPHAFKMLADLLRHPAARLLTMLDLSRNGIDVEKARWIASSESIRRIRTLKLYDNLLGDPGVTALLSSPHLEGLFALNLSANQIGPAGASAFAEARLERLRTLNLRNNNVRDRGVEAIAASMHVGPLEEIDLSSNDLGPRSASALASSERFVLRALDLGINHITDDGIIELTASKRIEGLASLKLNNNDLSDIGMRALAASERLRQLVLLDLSGNAIGPAGARVIGAGHFEKLTTLKLRNTSIETRGLRSLTSSKLLRQLDELDLSSNNLKFEGAKTIAECRALRKLTALDLSYNRIDDDGARALASSEFLGALRALNLRDNGINAPGASALAASERLPQLARLDLRNNAIGVLGQADLAALAKRRGCKIEL